MKPRPTYLPTSRRMTVCVPASARHPEDALCVRLNDNLLESLGVGSGNLAIISLLDPPKHGEPGAVRHNGKCYVGYIFFTAGDGIVLGSAEMKTVAKCFSVGTYQILGRVDRVCKSCDLRACQLVHPITSRAMPAEGKGIEYLRWSTDVSGHFLVSAQVREWITLFGGNADEWEGWGWADFLHPEDREAYLARWKESLGTGTPYLNHGRIYFAGMLLYMTVSASPVSNGGGNIIAWEGFLHLEPVESRKSA